MRGVCSITLALLIGCTAPLRAGGLLGAIYDTCLSSLGEPVHHASVSGPPPADVYGFQKGDWLITIFFWKHTAHMIVYEHLNEARMLSTEVSTILRAYGDGCEWSEDAGGHCTRGDGNVHARITATMVALYTEEYDLAADMPPPR